MDLEKFNRINSFLVKCGTSYTGLSESKQRLFDAVDEAIQGRCQRVKEAELFIKQQAINVQNIAADSGLARKTFYNNNLLRLYVEEYASEANDSLTKANEDVKRLTDEISRLKLERQKMVDRDREVELNRLELNNMRRELKILRQEKEELQRKNAELLSAKERKTSKQNAKVLFPKDCDLGAYFGKS